MSKSIKLFFKGIANCFNPNGYYKVVTRPKAHGEISSRIKAKRATAYKKFNQNQK